MSNQKQPDKNQTYSAWQVVVSILATFIFFGLILFVVVVAMTPSGQSAASYIRWLFAANSVQIWWYVTRASGIIAYLLLWFSTILGLAVTSKYLDGMLDRLFTYDFHEFISLLSVAFTAMRNTVALIKGQADELARVPITIVGGGTIDEAVARYIGADHWTTDAMEGVRICQRVMEGAGQGALSPE
jgi:hypothetical protein